MFLFLFSSGIERSVLACSNFSLVKLLNIREVLIIFMSIINVTLVLCIDVCYLFGLIK
jgi:hypothetical protein